MSLVGKIKSLFLDALPRREDPLAGMAPEGSADDRRRDRLDEEEIVYVDEFELIRFRGLKRERVVRLENLEEFLRENPHPKPFVTQWCEANERDRDYSLGSAFCAACRDRLAVGELLLRGAPGVRVAGAR